MPQTGATRYQKFLKSEKAKTKLKAKKDLPKGTNVTKTNFKVKKIVIKEQLKKHSDTEALSKRKLSAKDLVSRLSHLNVKTRTDALEGLNELASAHPEAMSQNLGHIILGISPLLLNVERVVRRESLKVLHAILSTTSSEKIEPFFDILSTFLRSAMTQIDNRIQEDSLLFLDILLSCSPLKMIQDFHKIIPNFLDMISKLRIDSKPGRTLTMNLDSQNTSVKWRIKVLHRLQDYLQKFSEFKVANNFDKSVEKTVHYFDKENLNRFPLHDPVYESVCYISRFSSKNWQDSVIIDETEKFKEYTETLMPLLFETWVEVCPKTNYEKNIESVVNEDVALLLKHSLEVITLLWNLIQNLDEKNPNTNIENYFRQKYRQSFTQHFVKSFPYVTNLRPKQLKADTPFVDGITDPKLVAENLQICYLFILLNPNINVKTQNIEIDSILKYVEKAISPNAKCDNMIVKVLHSMFSNSVTGWTRNLSLATPVFRKIILTYYNSDVSNKFKQQLFALLCKISLNDKMSQLHSCDAYQRWIKDLPDILLESSVTVQTIDIIHKFAVRNNNIFNSVIKPKLLSILHNLPKLVITDSVDDTHSYYKLFSLFYWVKSWDNDALNLLEKHLLDNVYKPDHTRYIFDTLNLKSGNVLY